MLVGWLGTGSGATNVVLTLDVERAVLSVHARWMGQPELELTLDCEHRVVGSHSGALAITGARRGDEPVPLPPSDGRVIVEYVRVPPQPTEDEDDEDETYTMVLWLHPQSYFDDGTELEASQYEVPPEQFRPVVDALKHLTSPWKLGPADA